MMDRDTTTRTGVRAPGAERRELLEWRCFKRPASPTLIGDQGYWYEEHEGRKQTGKREGYAGSGLTGSRLRKAPLERPALEPYWGKPVSVKIDVASSVR